MKTFGILALLLILLAVGSFIFVATSDVPVEQTTITRDLPTDQLK